LAPLVPPRDAHLFKHLPPLGSRIAGHVAVLEVAATLAGHAVIAVFVANGEAKPRSASPKLTEELVDSAVRFKRLACIFTVPVPVNNATFAGAAELSITPCGSLR